jgi:membrane protein DedA with SNARE-associated domain
MGRLAQAGMGQRDSPHLSHFRDGTHLHADQTHMRIGLPETVSACKVFMPLFGNLVHLLLQFFYAHELLTLFVALLVEEAGIPIPIPGDALLMLAGAESHKTVWSGVADIVVCSVAVFLGSSLLFRVMRRGGRALLLKYGKYVHLSSHALDRLERWFLQRV